MQKYAVDFEYDLRDVSERGGVELKGQPKLLAGLKMMRYIFSDDLERRLSEIFQPLRAMTWTDALEYARSLLVYLSSARKKIPKQKVREVMENIFPQPEFDKSALFIQEWMEEGAQIGLSSLTLSQLEHRLGVLDEMTRAQIQGLSNQQLKELGLALLHFTAQAELQQWLDDNTVVV